MKRTWFTSMIALSLVVGTIGIVRADNKFKFNSGNNNSRNLQMSSGNGGQNSTLRRLSTSSLGNNNSLGSSGLGTIKTPIKTHQGGLGISGLNQNPQILNSVRKLNNPTVSSQILTKPGLAQSGNGNGLAGILGSQGSQSGNSQLLNSNAAKNILPAILGNNKNNQFCDPGFNKKNCNPCWSPCKIGCNPWWYGCYSWCDPCYKPCYPVVYSQPILIPVATPIVTSAAPVGGVIEEKLMQVPAGATLTLQALDLGTTAGQVVLQFNQMAMPAMVNEWKNDAVTATLPPMGLASPVKGEITIVKADGKVASSIKVEVIPAQPPTGSGVPAATATGTPQ
jgi:hypothetical protein